MQRPSGSALGARRFDRRTFDVYELSAQIFLGAAMFCLFDVQRISTTIRLGLIVLGLCSLVVAPKGSVAKVRISPWFALLLAWWVMSYQWRNDPRMWMLMFRGQLLLLVVVALHASILDFEKIAKAMLACMYVTLLDTYKELVLHPGTSTIHIDPDGGPPLPGWHGTFIHKNNMTQMLLVGLLLMVFYEQRRWLRYAGIGLSLVLFAGAHSSTGLISLLVVVAAVFWLRRYREENLKMSASYVLLTAIFGLVMIAIGFLLLPLVTSWFGKEVTFSGRTEIWSASLWAIGKKPWTGFGPGGLWFNRALPPMPEIDRRIGFLAAHAHNGVLDLTLQLGVIGAALWIGCCASVFARAWRRLRLPGDFATFVILVLVSQLVVSLSEANLFGGFLFLLAICHGATYREWGRDSRARRSLSSETVVAGRR
jgi:O-antigen ligase